MITTNNLCLGYDGTTIIRDLNLSLPGGSITALLGPSGCGKTTLLRALSGLLSPQNGTLIIERPAATLFQEPRLLPWMSALQNVAFVLRHTKNPLPRAQAHERAALMLDRVGLGRHRQAWPHTLSGGMRQRVALARAFAFPAQVLLMDEPFQSLDLPLRLALLKTFLELWQAEPRTTLLVTHDPAEAILTADRILVLGGNPARILEDIAVPSPRPGALSADTGGLQSRIVKALQAASMPQTNS